jgi:hypothetical protein
VPEQKLETRRQIRPHRSDTCELAASWSKTLRNCRKLKHKGASSRRICLYCCLRPCSIQQSAILDETREVRPIAEVLPRDVLMRVALVAATICGAKFGKVETRRRSPSRGENPTVVQKTLRHANVTTTLGLYSHVAGDDRLTAQRAFYLAASEKVQ